MEACYGGTDVMEGSCAVARGIDINKMAVILIPKCRCRYLRALLFRFINKKQL
jgi:hypothetical protein